MTSLVDACGFVVHCPCHCLNGYSSGHHLNTKLGVVEPSLGGMHFPLAGHAGHLEN